MKNYLILLFLVCSKTLFAQSEIADTIKEKKLNEVIIRAFEQNRQLQDIPASVNYINRTMMNRFSTSSIVQAVNSMPGVRMEERSPGSYRFNIRGSSLRSPFGVRNVKIYFNDLPYTDPSGNTYLNQLGNYNFNSIEIIKGPGSSVYGAGTGGVLLIESLNEYAVPGFNVDYTGGSFGYHDIHGSFTSASDKLTSNVAYQHQQSSGYRNHSAMKRDVLSWTGDVHLPNNSQLKLTWLYSDLFYETPGALNKAEFDLNPKAARPTTGPVPSAEKAQAAIFQKTFIAGASYIQPITSKWNNKTVVYGTFSELRNPGIRNYGKNSEPHTGARTSFNYLDQFNQAVVNFSAGGEWQQGFFTENVYKNLNGNPDTLQTSDNINNRQLFGFAQASVSVKNWIITAGASWNWLDVRFQRFSPGPAPLQVINFNNEIAPRFSVLKKLKNISIYSSVGKGFSPPTVAELFPTGSAANAGLNAEKGLNYDLGFRGTFFRKLYVDINGFLFSLNSTIVQRRDLAGGDYYINSGKTNQHGLEAYFNYPLLQSLHLIDHSLIWASYTLHDFHYKDFKQLNNDFSGKQLPGEPLNSIAAGYDIYLKKGFYGVITYYFADKIPLNDANSSFADSYHILGAKLGYKQRLNSLSFDLFAGGNNLLNTKYSLGNDINAAAGRYYNAAAGINYYAGISIQWIKRKASSE